MVEDKRNSQAKFSPYPMTIKDNLDIGQIRFLTKLLKLQ
jgi:hypothetical protein